MIPFVLPWDDASESATDVSFLLKAPAGSDGWVYPDDDGHLADSAGRVRFWGVNVVASACFPSQSEADSVAGRMAKFGFNCVRFHHLEQTWETPTLLDYAQGNSRSMLASSLDSLQYFMYALKQKGIYWNLNLHVARRFSSGDGLPAEINAMGWAAQKGIALVRADMIELQKEYARQLLLSVNPYTGMAPAEDPALAVVEISNENGLLHVWLGGEVDAWPAAFRAEFQSSWNEWLAARYSSHSAMLEGWGVVTDPLGAEMLGNGGFTSGTSSWNLEQHGTARANATVGTYSGRQGVKIAVTQAGSEGWHVQFTQSGLSLVKGQVYTLSYWARADSTTTVNMGMGLAHDPWSAILSSGRTLGSSWQYYESSFEASVTDSNTRVVLNGMGNRVGSVYLAGVSLRPGGDPSGLPEGATLAKGNIPILRRDSSYAAGMYSDWLRFLEQVESEYWAEMKRYIREDIGYRGLIVGSIISTSTPNIQSHMDVVDSHSYWQHPVFTNGDWSATDWTVGRESMLNERGGILGSLAAQRVKGMPFFVTEYQHCAPNTFSSEAPLMLSAYAGFQDWDGVFFFQYGGTSHNWGRGYFNSFFDIDQHPSKMANALLGALMFLRQDVASAKNEYVLRLDPEREIELIRTKGNAWSVAHGLLLGLDEATPLLHRVSLSVGALASGLDTPPLPPSSGSAFVADTGELTWDVTALTGGVLTIDTPRTKALLGFTDTKVHVFSNGIAMTPGLTEQGWSTIALSAIQGNADTLPSGTRLLVVTTGNIANTGMVWKSAEHTSVGSNWGRTPSLVERIPATISLPVPADSVRFRSLNALGAAMRELGVQSGADASSCQISLGTEATLWYEVEIVGNGSYDFWAKEWFTSAQSADESVSGRDADPDGDGYSNWDERAFGLDPLVSDSPFVFGQAYPAIIASGDGARFAFYVRSAGLADASIVAEVSSDLINWREEAMEAYSDAAYPGLLRLHVQDAGEPLFVRVSTK